jgi:PhnB protein
MTMSQKATSPIKEAGTMGVPRISPHLVCAGAAKAMEFYKEAFGATEMIRLPGPDGRLMHGCVSINGAWVMLVDEFPEMGNKSPTTLKGTPVTIHLIVDDVDTFTARAVAAGATVVMPVADQFWGDRYGIVADPFGHHWSIATPGKEPVSAEELQARVANMTFECGQDGPAAA